MAGTIFFFAPKETQKTRKPKNHDDLFSIDERLFIRIYSRGMSLNLPFYNAQGDPFYRVDML